MTNAEGHQEEAAPPRRTLWPWIALAAVIVVAIGAVIGASLATRQNPLASPGTGGARPTIVLATVSPSVSVGALPSPSAGTATAVAAAPGGAGTIYVVQPGDTLRSIAESEYGDATLWPRIYDANRDVIGPDPDALQAGMQLRIPPQ